VAREDLIVWLLVLIVLVGLALILVLTRRARTEHRYERAIQMKATDVMSHPVLTVRVDDTLERAARAMLERNVGSLLVVGEDGRLVGILTQSDLTGAPGGAFRAPRLLGETLPEEGAERIYEEARGKQVKELMSKVVTTVGEEESVTHVIRRMVELDLRHLPVVREGVPVGIVTRRDLLRLMLPHQPRA
jgi:CBS domain-containing protein